MSSWSHRSCPKNILSWYNTTDRTGSPGPHAKKRNIGPSRQEMEKSSRPPHQGLRDLSRPATTNPFPSPRPRWSRVSQTVTAEPSPVQGGSLSKASVSKSLGVTISSLQSRVSASSPKHRHPSRRPDSKSDLQQRRYEAQRRHRCDRRRA